jgi:threonine dehydratase
MQLPTLAELENAAALVHDAMQPTLQYNWPLLALRCGCEVWVKHENHTPIGAFKIRGGIVFMDDLKKRGESTGVITATRGNHGQSIGLAARNAGISAIITVPEGNSVEKNAAMSALGVEMVVKGHDFQVSREYAMERAESEGLTPIPPFHPLLVRGVGTYGMEFLRGAPSLDIVYVPIGMGSGICGMMAARDALGLKTEIVGVVAEQANAYELSFAAGHAVSTNSADTMADGLACRTPEPEAVALINKGASRIVSVSEDEIKAAMRIYYTDTHNLAEGAGAAPLAALLKEKTLNAGKTVGLILSGGNVDLDVFRQIIAEPAI